MVVKQCCDSKPEPSQQGNSDERNVGWSYMVLIDTKYNRQGSLDTPFEAQMTVKDNLSDIYNSIGFVKKIIDCACIPL